MTRAFLVVALGILLIMIGNGVENSWLRLVGTFLFAVSLFWGGLSLEETRVPIRVTMLAVAGLAVYSMISGGSSISSYLQ